jgi:hypothetical protein
MRRALLPVALVLGLCSALEAQEAPWWDSFPRLVSCSDADLSARVHANAAMCGGADDPTWGLFGQRSRWASFGKSIAQMHDRGLKALIWVEAFGTTGSYVAQLKRSSDGSWVKDAANPELTRIFAQHWCWQIYDGSGEIHWVGVPNYYDEHDFARPYVRSHPRYGSPPISYPDGAVAQGFIGSADDPRNSRIYDAACSKNVLGQVTFEYGYHTPVNRISKETGEPVGPIGGLLNTGDAPLGPPDPGFTPEEWARLRRQRWAGNLSAGKDSACPAWADYAHASILHALDLGVDGLWVDNFSPWDSFNGNPLLKAFGEWSVAGFRTYLQERFDAATLAQMSVGDPATFDVRTYLQNRCREWGGDPQNLRDPRWRDARWQDDPIWRTYLVYKRRTGTEALSRFYQTIKQTAAGEGKPDFLVSGNDIPIFSLGWVRGNLDMVSTELSWGWGLTTGPRGIMPPPLGCYVPVYKLAREHARSRFVNVWLYVPDEQKGKPNVARVLYYQALANHTLPMPHYPGRTAGNEAVDAGYFGFVESVAPQLEGRTPVEDVGLFYSSSSQLMEMLPGGFRNHADQPHSFSFYGWGAALTGLHVPWRAVSEWKLTTEGLVGLRTLIIPSAQVFAPEDLPVLSRFVHNGGWLVIAGTCGTRVGETGHFAPHSEPLTVNTVDPDLSGPGCVVTVPDDPGLAYYRATEERPHLLEAVRRALLPALVEAGASVDAREVPWTVSLTPYRQPGRLIVDVNNTQVDLATDTLTATGPLTFTVALPEELRGVPLQARVLSPDGAPSATLVPRGGGHVTVTLTPIEVFASVIIERAAQ